MIYISVSGRLDMIKKKIDKQFVTTITFSRANHIACFFVYLYECITILFIMVYNNIIPI